MSQSMSQPAPGLQSTYAEFDRLPAVSKIRWGVVLACVLLPLGAFIDQIIYPEKAGEFLIARFIFGGAMLPLGWLIGTRWGQRFHQPLGVAMAMVPAACMAWIIAESDQARSPYYAGLNLVLLAVGLLLRWNLWQSVIATCLVLAMYVGVCVPVASNARGIFANNLYFVILTGIIVVLGNWVHTTLRHREFEATRALDEKRVELEQANSRLGEQSRALQQANSFLEQSRADLQRSNQRLLELDQLKRNFFANISHELRTPLTLILAPIDRLRSTALAQGDPEMRQTFETMQANGFRLLKLINDLLDLVRLEAGTLQLNKTRIDVPQYLRGILMAMQPAATEKGIELRSQFSPDLPLLLADAHQLERVFFNLIFNAIKFTPAGGSITLRTERLGNEALVKVIDTGIGIAPEHVQNVFQRFWQADSSAERKYQGAGIGLALVRDLTETHGGSVSVESALGTGTTMIVRLPAPSRQLEELPVLAPAKPAAPTESEAQPEWLASLHRRAELFPGIAPLRQAQRTKTTPAATTRGHRVLVADDEPDMLVFIRTHLAGEYEVLEAVDGAQAVALATQYLPEVIICDMMMPDKNGVQVCRELQERPDTRAIPFLMLTARADDETKLAALSAGAHDFLTKPFSSAELTARVRNLTRAFRLQRDLAWQNRKLEATLEQLKETELQLVQSEKLAGLGRLSAGILHEINNPLNFSKTAVFTLRRQAGQLPEETRTKFDQPLADLSEGIDRVARIVTDMRKFTHKGPDTLAEISVAGTVQSALRFLAAELREKIVVKTTVPEDFLVMAHQGKLLQVFTNLIQNAADALNEKPPAGATPTITISTETVPGAAFVRVRDNGPGIPADVATKIFDPFFTTKEVGKGTGLGLSICFRIMNEFGGFIRVRSEVGQFTEFALEFPAR
jgi:signal transduction histidine kinase